MTGKFMAAAVGLIFSALILGCGESAPPTAKAVLVNDQGQKVGEATLTETPQGVKISLKVENLPPGAHAFHIHEKSVRRPGLSRRRRPLQSLRQAARLKEP